MTKPTHERSESARRGNEIFEQHVRPRVDEEREARKFVAIDLASGDFEVDRDKLAAADRLRNRKPDARVWFRRVGSRFAHHIGGRLSGEQTNT